MSAHRPNRMKRVADGRPMLAEAAGALRFASAAHFAMHAGVAPLPVSSRKSNRYRLNRAATGGWMPPASSTWLSDQPKARAPARDCAASSATWRTVWQAMRSAEMRRQALRTDACPAAQPALARASSGVDIGATSDCGIVFGGSLR